MQYKEARRLATEYEEWADGELRHQLKGDELVRWVDTRKVARMRLEDHCYRKFDALLEFVEAVEACPKVRSSLLLVEEGPLAGLRALGLRARELLLEAGKVDGK